MRTVAVILTAAMSLSFSAPALEPLTDWSNAFDRVWLGEALWANPMEDWRMEEGRAVCLGGPNRNAALLTREVDPSAGSFWLVFVCGRATGEKGTVGLRVGLKDEISDYRAAALRGKGIDAGIGLGGRIFLGETSAALDKPFSGDATILNLRGAPEGDLYRLQLHAETLKGEPMGHLEADFPPEAVAGLVALVNNHGAGDAGFWFTEFQGEGPALVTHEDRAWGPILWAMHTLSDGVLKMTAQLPPLGRDTCGSVSLELRGEDGWAPGGEAVIDPDARTATFRVAGWDATRDVPYRLTAWLTGCDGTPRKHTYAGTVRREPAGRPVVVAGFTGNMDYVFPNLETVRNVGIHDPDLLFFSGDQIYEQVGGYGIIREPADRSILNYLRKWYLLGWAFGDLMRDRLTVCLPDDHDVYQGNIWGEGGIDPGGMANHDAGGYAQPVRMVNAVNRTQTAHHPDFPDPAPIARGISVFHGNLEYGGVSFAIVADRMFKSGPKDKVNMWEGRADHVKDPAIDVAALDRPGLKLLGDRQIAFLEAWVRRDARLRILLSQTIFCNLANYHGPDREFIIADLDSNGWPQSGRNRALEVLRRGDVFHLAGDQHLPSIVRHGIDEFGDAIWSFCVPSIAAGYPRRWIPDEEGRPVRNRPEVGLPNTGEYLDGLGNRMTVYAIGNPEEENRPGLVNTAHDKASGYGIVRADPEAQTITMECWRYDTDAAHPQPGDQFPGWPMTIRPGD